MNKTDIYFVDSKRMMLLAVFFTLACLLMGITS